MGKRKSKVKKKKYEIEHMVLENQPVALILVAQRIDSEDELRAIITAYHNQDDVEREYLVVSNLGSTKKVQVAHRIPPSKKMIKLAGAPKLPDNMEFA